MCEIRHRLPNDDKRKSATSIKKQMAEGKACVVCGKPISLMSGPGSDMLCRKHQIEGVEYGGTGKSQRPYLFHRGNSCEVCGYEPSTDPDVTQYKGSLDEVEYSRMLRSLMEVNHRNGDHNDNRPENCQTVCTKHHRIITILNKHYKKKKIILDKTGKN
jgi:hypothetical protein